MSGISEATLDPAAIAGSGKPTSRGDLSLESQQSYTRNGSSRRMAGNRGLSTRSTAMSEVSALDYLQEDENEDDDPKTFAI